MPKEARSGGRTSAFGLINKPKTDLRREIDRVARHTRHEVSLTERSVTRVLPVKRLRNNLINAMCLNVATQPTAVIVRHKEPNTLRRGKHAQQTVVWNPIWDLAPSGAFYKSKRVCSLVTDVIAHGFRAKISHDLERLAINIWRMSKRHFDGLLRTIRAKMAKLVVTSNFRKSPEALKRFEALIRNPYQPVRGYRFSRNRVCRHDAEFAAMRLSTKVGLVRESLKCTKCTSSARADNGLLHMAVAA